VFGIVFSAILAIQDIRIGGIQLNVGTLMMACMAVIVGFQLAAFAFFTKVFAIAEGLLPADMKFARLFKVFTLEKGVVAGLLVLLAGLILFLRALWIWKQAEYGVLPYADNLRRLIPAATFVILGIQIVFSSFFMSVLGLSTASRRPPAVPKENSAISDHL